MKKILMTLLVMLFSVNLYARDSVSTEANNQLFIINKIENRLRLKVKNISFSWGTTGPIGQLSQVAALLGSDIFYKEFHADLENNLTLNCMGFVGDGETRLDNCKIYETDRDGNISLGDRQDDLKVFGTNAIF